jgi:hypothetical protein
MVERMTENHSEEVQFLPRTFKLDLSHRSLVLYAQISILNKVTEADDFLPPPSGENLR